MKFIKPMLLAAALLSPFAAVAQTTPPADADVDATGTRPTGTETETDRNRATESDVNGVTPLPGTTDSKLDKHRMDLQTQIAEIRRDLTDTRSTVSAEGSDKLNSINLRLDDLESRVMTAGDEREFRENKHKFKNELKKIRKELKSAQRKNRASIPDAEQSAPPANP